MFHLNLKNKIAFAISDEVHALFKARSAYLAARSQNRLCPPDAPKRKKKRRKINNDALF